MSAATVEQIWRQDELEALVKKMSVNYRAPEEVKINYPLRAEFYKKAKLDLFQKQNLSPENVPTQSTIILGQPLIGKSLLMEAWREYLKNETFKITNRMDDYSREYGEDWRRVYDSELSNFSHAWICERDTTRYFNNFENDPDEYRRLVFKKYFFLDDVFFRKYDYKSGKKTSENFTNFQESLFRFLELNKDIIVIASTNNYPHDILAEATNETILTRFNVIFAEDNRIVVEDI